MSRVIIIGAGGVSSVVVAKCAMNAEVFKDICIASRTKSKCDELKNRWQNKSTANITTAQVDADNVADLVNLFKNFKPELVINVALPYQDLTIMDACLEYGCHYLDTANYEHPDTAKFEYSWQWAYREKFEKAGLTAILGCGFDPGVTQAYSAFAQKHYFDEIHELDILDANGGDHGYPFATNFNPEINIREVTAEGKYWENGEVITVPAMSVKRQYNFDKIGMRDMYLLHHEEIESLALNLKGIRRIRFFMTFGERYLTHLKVLENVGMTSIKPIDFEGKQIVPLQFLKAILPDPASLGPRTKGHTNIGCIFKGIKNGKARTHYIYNICNHEECYRETGAQGVSYTTGVPAMAGAMMVLQNHWKIPGVWNVEQLNPDPFLQTLEENGLGKIECENPVLVD